MLGGGTAALKVGVIQAVAADINGHVPVQCLASTRLLFPPLLDGQPLPLPHTQRMYSGMRAAEAGSRPAVSYNCSEMPKVHKKCVSIILSLPAAGFRPEAMQPPGLKRAVQSVTTEAVVSPAVFVGAALAADQQGRYVSANKIETKHRSCLTQLPACSLAQPLSMLLPSFTGC